MPDRIGAPTAGLLRERLLLLAAAQHGSRHPHEGMRAVASSRCLASLLFQHRLGLLRLQHVRQTGTKSHGSGQGLRRYGRRMDLLPCGTGCLRCLRRGGHAFSNGIGMPFGSSIRRFRGYRAFPGLGGLIDGEGGLFVCAVRGRRSVARAPLGVSKFEGPGKFPKNSVDNLRPGGYDGYHSRSQSGSVGHLNNWIVKGNRQNT